MDAPDSFMFAKDTVVQLITLATALIGVSVTFAKDMVTSVEKQGRGRLHVAWVTLLLSVLFGIWALMSLTGTVAKITPLTADAIYGLNILVPSTAQICLFIVGIAGLIYHAVRH